MKKVRLIHGMMRDGTNSHVTFCERLVLPRLKDVVQGVVALLGDKSNSEARIFSHWTSGTRSSSCM